MSSGSPSATVGAAVGVAAREDDLSAPSTGGSRASTFWCYECDVGVSLDRSANPLVCPICSGGFLEEMELPDAQDHGWRGLTETLVSPPQPQFDEDGELLPSPPPPPFAEFLIESDDDSDPRPHRVYFNVRTLAGFIPSVGMESPVDDLLADLVPEGDPPIAASHAPAPKSSIDAIPAVPVTESFLADDPHRLCAVCKDEFVLGSEAKRLPCSHVYHGDCIVPWLSRHNSCPLCRSQLPVPCGPDRDSRVRSHPNSGVAHFPGFEASNPWSYFNHDDEMDEVPASNVMIDDVYRPWVEELMEEPTSNAIIDDSYQPGQVADDSHRPWLIAPSTRLLRPTRLLSQRQVNWDYFFEAQEDMELDRRQHNDQGRVVRPQLLEDGAVGAESMDGSEDPAIAASGSTLH